MGLLFVILLVIGFIIFIYKALNDSTDNTYNKNIEEQALAAKLAVKNMLFDFLNEKPTNNEIIDNNNLLVFDLETTGLPIDRDAPVSDLDNWPKIVSASFLLYDKDGLLLEEYTTLLKQTSEIPIEAINIHKITTEEANEKGVDFKEFNEKLRYYANYSKILCAHNIDFDYKVLQAELKRNKFKNCFSKHKKICTMVKGKKLTGYRPSLIKLIEECYGKNIIDYKTLHNANFDARLAGASFFYLMQLDYIDRDIFK